jgi:hypothetical protein
LQQQVRARGCFVERRAFAVALAVAVGQQRHHLAHAAHHAP